MESITIDSLSVGKIKLTFSTPRAGKTLRMYVSEFLGSDTPPAEIQGLVDGFVTLPGYGDNPLRSDISGSLLTWENYGKALSLALSQSFSQPIGLLGNSMGAMESIYAALEDPSVIDHLVLYKIPNFGARRTNIRGKYAHVASSITDIESFQTFIRKAQGKVDDDVMAVLKSLKWQDAKKLYLGAAASDLNLTNIDQLTMPIYFLENPVEADTIHPLEAQTYLFNLLTGSKEKRVFQTIGLQEKVGTWVVLGR